MNSLTCITWNVHRARGQDGRVDPARVASAIETALVPHRPDVLALQEADGECPPHVGILDIARIESSTGLVCAHNEARLRWGPQSDGFLGTILFLHPKLTTTHADVLDLPGHCHRGAICVETLGDGRAIRIISAHLSLSQPLRIIQMRIIGQYLMRRPAMETIIMGDLNEWRPWASLTLSARIIGAQFTGPVRRTFPTGRPLLPLDRILVTPGGQIENTQVVDTPQTNMASDHRPLMAQISFQ